MKKGDILEGIVTKTEFPNKGIVKIDDYKITVKNALEGQTIRFSVSKKKKDKIEGRLLEILKPSAIELKHSKCQHFGNCGGCSYQNLSYEQQLNLKKKQVERLIEKSGLNQNGQSLVIEEILGSPIEEGYRNKMEFSFGDEVKDGPLALGMHKRNSFYDIVTLQNCKIIDRDIQTILTTVLEYFTKIKASYYRKMSHRGFLRHLVVRRSIKTGELLINLVTTSQDKLDKDTFVQTLISLQNQYDGIEGKEAQEKDQEKGQGKNQGKKLGEHQEENQGEHQEKIPKNDWDEKNEPQNRRKIDGKIAGILWTINDSAADIVQSDETLILYGQDYLYEYLFNLKFKISPFSFFQTNTLGAEVLYDKVREYVGDTKDKIIFDLYSGTGTIAQIVAPVAQKVYGVEIVEEAVEAARENASINHLSNCEFIAGDVLKVIDNLTRKPDIIILDPPRDGINPKALKKIINFGCDRIIYISCKPTSLMRDLGELMQNGYEVSRMCCVDMFPGTVHVETVCLLSKLHSAHHIEVELEMDELDLTAAESKATYEEIKDYVLKQSGLKVSNLYIAQVKQKCGIIERVNYNLPKSENSRQPKCPPEKEKAIKEALEHFQMI